MPGKMYVVKVVALAAILSTATWFGLPVLKAKMPDAYFSIAQVSQGQGSVKEVGENISVAAEKVAESGKAAVEALPQKVQEADADVATSIESSVETEEASVATNATEEADAAEAPAEPVELDTMSALNADPGYPWGIVVTNSFFFDKDMVKKGILPGGTVIACKDRHELPKGNVVECLYLSSRIWGETPVMIYESDLVTFDGTYENAPRKDRDILIEYCKLYGRLEDLRARAYSAILNRNPHKEEYRAMAIEYREFNAKIRAAKQKYDVSTGTERMKLGDELRNYKYEQTGINERYRTASEKYNKWKTDNVDSRAGQIKTPDMVSIENAMERLRPEVERIVPGL